MPAVLPVTKASRFLSWRSMSVGSNLPELLHQREVVLDVPVVDDTSVGDAQNVGGYEVHDLPRAPLPGEGSGEMAGETKVRHDSIAGDDQLPDLAPQIGHGSAEALRGEGWAVGALGAALRQRTVGEPWRDRRGEIPPVAGVPEGVETSCREDGGVGPRARQRRVQGQR